MKQFIRSNKFFTNLIFLTVLVLIQTSTLIAVSPRYNTTMDRDNGVYQYASWRVLEGDVLYRDVWDHKPPLIFLWNALAYLARGDASQTSIWTLISGLMLLTTALCFFLLTRLFSGPVAFLATLFLPISLPHLEFLNTTETYALVFQVGILVLFLAERPKRDALRLFLIGVLSALAFFTKQTTIGISAVVGLWLIFDWYQSGPARSPRILVRQLFWLIIGFATPTLCIVVYFAAQHALADFWSAAFVFNFGYSSVDLWSKFKTSFHGLYVLRRLHGLTDFAFLGWLLAGFYLRRPQAKALIHIPGTQDQRVFFMIFCGGIVEPILTSISGNQYPHYYITLLPVFVLAAALFFSKLIHINLALTAWPSSVLVAILFLFLLSSQIEINYRDKYWPFNPTKSDPAQIEVVAYIRDHSLPEEKLLMVGAEANINFITRRASPTRYVYQYPITRISYSRPAMVDEFLSQVEVNQPRLIIDTHNQEILKGSYNNPDFLYSLFDQDFFREHCALQPNALGNLDWDVYRCEW